MLLPNGFELLGVLLSNPLFARLTSGRKRESFDISVSEIPVLQEMAHERVRLLVLAEEDDTYATQLSHPLAIDSESESPSIFRSGSVLTRTGPVPSR